MRILHVVHQYPPDHVAGTELYTQWLAQSQAKAGHQVAVFTPLNRDGPLMAIPTSEAGVSVYRRPVGARSASAVFLSTFRQPQLASDFLTVLASERPDIIHIEHLMGLPLEIMNHIWRSGVPYVIFLHDYWFGCANGQLFTNDSQRVCSGSDLRSHNCGRCAVARAGFIPLSGLVGPLVAPIMSRRNDLLADVVRGAARLIAANEFVCRIHQEMGFSGEQMIIIPMGVESPPVDTPHATLAGTSPGLRLGYIGSISSQKGVHILIEAVNGLPHDGVTLGVFGDLAVFPDYAAKLQSRANHPGIRFGGRLDRSQVWSALAGFDALVFPSLWYETAPFSIREAFAARVPVIASDIGAPAVMVRDGIDGRLFPAGDAVRLRSILEELLANPKLLESYRQAIRLQPSIDDHAAAVEALYHQVLAEASST